MCALAQGFTSYSATRSPAGEDGANDYQKLVSNLQRNVSPFPVDRCGLTREKPNRRGLPWGGGVRSTLRAGFRARLALAFSSARASS